MTSLVDKLVPDDLWAIVESLLPAPPRPPYGGRQRTIGDPQLLRRHRVHGPHLYPMAALARSRTRLRLAGDRLAPAGPVGQGRRV